MRAFRFRLARLLRVRRLEEEVARGELAHARGRANEARSSAEHAEAEVERGRGELLRLQAGPLLEPAAVIARHAAQDGVARARATCERRALELEREAGARRSTLMNARAAVRGLERLAERRRALHLAQLERAERLELDEVAQRTRRGARASLPRLPGSGGVSSPSPRPTDEDGQAPRAQGPAAEPA
jgi:flagellar protein FliJ